MPTKKETRGRKKQGWTLVRITVGLLTEQLKALKYLAEETGKTVGKLIREAVVLLLKAYKRKGFHVHDEKRNTEK